MQESNNWVVHKNPTIGLPVKIQQFGSCAKIQQLGCFPKSNNLGLCAKIQQLGLLVLIE
jgi:hypothetical protein